MMRAATLRKQLRELRTRTGIEWNIVEQDYVLTAVLWGISNTPILKESLVFKGGTALKKCYFGDYRFSQDLDFSVVNDVPTGDDLLKLMQSACSLAEQ